MTRVIDLGVEQKPRKSHYYNQFVVTIEFMHGATDFDATRTAVFPGDQKPLLIEFLNFLHLTQEALNKNQYLDSVPGYEKFGNHDQDQFEYGLEDGWPVDCNTSCEATLQQYYIAFYDHTGERYNVFVTEG